MRDCLSFFFFFQAEDGIRDYKVTGVQTCALPIFLAGRGNHTLESWRARVALAEKLNARVITDLKAGAVFPTRHALHLGPPGSFLAEAATKVLREADVVLSLDWIDLAGTLKQAFGEQITAKIISASCDVHLHRGSW